jgi:hypothetical protein
VPEKVTRLAAGCAQNDFRGRRRVRFRKIADLKASQDAPAQFFDKLVGRESKSVWLLGASLATVRDRNMKDRQ